LIKFDSVKKANNYPSSHFFLTGIHVNISSTDLIFAPNMDLLFQLKKNPKSLVGLSANFFVYGIFLRKNIPVYADYRLFNFDIGIRVLKHINRKLFLNINPQVILGKEHYVYSNYNYSNGPIARTTEYINTDPLFGFQCDFGLYSFPVQKQGFYFGADLFFRGTSSFVMEANFGIKLNLGYKF
jgi:hypothetical protein